MSLKIGEKNRVRLTLIVILLVFVSITAYSLNAESNDNSKTEITVDEGYDEIVIPEEEQPDEDLVTTYPQNKSIVTTNVNNESSLEFEVEPRSLKRDDVIDARIKLSAEGYFVDELEVSTFKFRASEKEEGERPFNSIDFKTSYSQIEGGERWPHHEQQTGSAMVGPEHFAYDGYDLDSNDFSVETMLYWEIDPENIGEEFTLQLEAIVGGLSEDVPATVDICLEGGDA